MSACPKCSELLHRLHRSAFERLFLSRVFYCSECRTKTRFVHDRVRQTMTRFAWLFSLRSSCIRCGSHSVKRAPRDRSSSGRPSLWKTMTQGMELPVYRCVLCDVTYGDVRPARSQVRQRATPGHARMVRTPKVVTPAADAAAPSTPARTTPSTITATPMTPAENASRAAAERANLEALLAAFERRAGHTGMKRGGEADRHLVPEKCRQTFVDGGSPLGILA